LRKISLFRTAVSNAGLIYLEKLPALEVLLMSGSRITQEGARFLKKSRPGITFDEQT
jgi:hypothetical protein